MIETPLLSKLMSHSKQSPNLRGKLTNKLKVEASERAQGRTGLYNPLLQKPVALEPVGPGSYPAGLGGYAYIGPPPDFGGSYGCYVDSAGRKQYGVKSSKQFSIYDGTPVALHGELSAPEREALLSQMDDASEAYKCEHCRAELTVSAMIKVETVHCPFCSSQMEGAVEKINQCYSKIEEKNMIPKDTPAKAPVKAEADLAKEAMKMDPPKAANEDVKLPKEVSVITPSIDKDASNMEVMKELEKPAQIKGSEEKAQIEAAATKRRERLEAAKKAFDEKKRRATIAKTKAKKNVKASADAQKLAELKKELRIIATFQPAKFAELKKNDKIAAVCAEVEKKLYTRAERDQVRAELATMAEADPIAAEKAKKELEFIAPEILMDEPAQEEKKAEDGLMESAKKDEKAKEEAPPVEKTEEEKAAEAAALPPAMPPAAPAAAAAPAVAKKDEEKKEDESKEEPKEDEKAEAMKTEFLASLKDLKAETVEMSLHGAETENPFWNIQIDAEPVGRIFLGDQENAEQIRSGFIADSYAQNFGQAMQQVGVEKMLTLAKARLFAHRADDTEAMVRVKAAAKLEAKADFDAKIETLRQDFMRSIATAMTASDKNMYGEQEGGHALKGGLFTAIAQAGVDPQHATWMIEAGFENAPQYFEFVTQKAIEIMDMPKDAREAFEKMVHASGKMEIAAGSKPEDETLRDRLVKASANAVAMGGFVGGEDKEAVRANLGLSANRR